jgi:tRNA-specific 2-thiouridylase
VKFKDLLEVARDLGAAALATGHYARRVPGHAGPELHRAADAAKDQSYFLFATTPDQLAFARFPVGGLGKAATRAHARRLGLPVADKPDSQDICFVPAGRYTGVVARLRPGALEPGEIVHVDGRTLGRHSGTGGFTVGQRRGLNVADGERLYVVGIDAAARRVVVGPREAGLCAEVELAGANWLAPRPGERVLEVKLRYNEPAVPARVADLGEGRALVRPLEPQPAVAPGQACVFYDGPRLVGGGWIDRAPPAWEPAARRPPGRTLDTPRALP